MFKVVVVLMGLLVAGGCVSHRNLGVQLGAPQAYESADGSKIVARYGKLSDGSLAFVKVTMPDGREYTLPQTISASGAKYSDVIRLTWWEHQGSVLVETMTEDGDWETKYKDVKPVSTKD